MQKFMRAAKNFVSDEKAAEVTELGIVLALVFESLGVEDNVVQKVLVDPLIQYEFSPMPLNLIVMTLTFGFSLNFNVLSLLGIGTAWYYAKYPY